MKIQISLGLAFIRDFKADVGRRYPHLSREMATTLFKMGLIEHGGKPPHTLYWRLTEKGRAYLASPPEKPETFEPRHEA